MELERANNRNEKDNMLIFIVQETLRVNNHIIKFLNGVGKVIVNNKEEQEILDLFDSANDFSFRSTKVLLHANKQKETKISNVDEYGFDQNFLTTKEIKKINLAKDLRLFLIEYESRKTKLNPIDQMAINGETSLLSLDLRFVPKNDFFLIKDLERENLKQNKDPVLITIVNEILRLNNYIIWFLKGLVRFP